MTTSGWWPKWHAQTGETIHHEPCPVTPDAVFSAIKTADLVGRNRQK